MVLAQTVDVFVKPREGGPNLDDPAAERGIPKFSGTWQPQRARQALGPDGKPVNPLGICHDPTGAGQLVTSTCAFPLDKLPLNKRAIAWLHFQDLAISGKYYCKPAGIPTLSVFPGYSVRFEQRNDHVRMEYNILGRANVERTIWTDGRPFPPPAEIAFYGFSVGRYEGNELVVETRNFTFDPTGIDENGRIPSSYLKHLTERYSVTGKDRMRLVLTIEDPLFLKEPYTDTFEMRPSELPIAWTACDEEISATPLMMVVPKYEDE
jgi:hypothetical protein